MKTLVDSSSGSITSFFGGSCGGMAESSSARGYGVPERAPGQRGRADPSVRGWWGHRASGSRRQLAWPDERQQPPPHAPVEGTPGRQLKLEDRERGGGHRLQTPGEVGDEHLDARI